MIRALFDGTYAPITFSVGFIQADIEKVAAGFSHWRQTIGHSAQEKVVFLNRLERLITVFPELSTPPTLDLFVQAKAGWVAYFDNSIGGTDGLSVVSYLSEQLECTGVLATSIPSSLRGDYDKNSGTYGAIKFSVFGANPTEWLNCRREISLTQDGSRWMFSTFGDELTFEDGKVYKARKATDRFSTTLLVRYCNEMDIDIENELFYGPEARLFSHRIANNADSRTLGFNEARRWHGI